MPEQQNKPIQKSNCCEAPISVQGGGEGTYYYKCEKCGNSCDPIYETSLMKEDTPPLTMEERLKSEFEKAYWSDDYPDLEDLVNRPDNISNWWLSKISSAVSWALKEQRDTILKLIDKYYLQYCREQNGLDHCKNCGLNIEELEKLLSNNKE